MEATAHIAVVGLGVMGRNLARNFARHGYDVAVHDRIPSRTHALIKEFGHEGTFVPAENPEQLVARLRSPRRLMIMEQERDATDAVTDRFTPLLAPGDIVVDGSRAHFADTRRREAASRERGVHFVGVGISGGADGVLHGPSITVGGSEKAYAVLGPMLETISARFDGKACCAHVGGDGAGHYVKMVHDGIARTDSQFLAEAYDMLRKTAGCSPGDIAAIFRTYASGRLNSDLLGITAEVLDHVDARTGSPFVDVVADTADRSGTGHRTVRTALDLASPATVLAQTVFAHSSSGHLRLRSAYRGLPGGDTGQLGPAEAERFCARVEHALYASRIIAYDQAWTMVQDAAAQYGWKIDLAAIAHAWRTDGIMRSALLDRMREAYTVNPYLNSLLADPFFAEEIAQAQVPWRETIASATRRGIPVPAMAAALASYDTLRAPRLPTALVQGQRDHFGAHAYHRIDLPGTYHTDWSNPERPEAHV
ncbi:NADP-dependent phosphogluconate dehydrogenase [Streptomyces sp. CB02400]|uniref:NADP-dependent phosphogluconate dehydrogenase n=1 Tax=Streptomyces sp. CB02400 TaxID=1703944 RepID=UPI00093E1D93|nr:NADP-dependent phosphogluconate dehydrogenase [Streptomyces sp. CB02400]OKK05029.1 6-phosphogluconate dehydrogenase [Streptomyces sp. CB02400]